MTPTPENPAETARWEAAKRASATPPKLAAGGIITGPQRVELEIGERVEPIGPVLAHTVRGLTAAVERLTTAVGDLQTAFRRGLDEL